MPINEDGPPYTEIPAQDRSDLLLICDHASNRIPPEFDSLGLPAHELERHIAYDIGAGPVTRQLAGRFGARALLGGISRLVIDPNRGLDDPTLVMKLSDGAIIPGNQHLTEEEVNGRVARFYRPYDQAISGVLDQMLEVTPAPKIVSIHSFTHYWRGATRPWHVGLLWNRDDRVFRRLYAALRRHDDLVVGDNEPYRGDLEGDCLDRHGTKRGIAHILIELRQDLISDEAGVEKWTDILFDAISTTLNDAPDGFFNQVGPPHGEV